MLITLHYPTNYTTVKYLTMLIKLEIDSAS